jgi:catechol 2,3-dioxygenase-like lactoylglutathione lyase family enzyme
MKYGGVLITVENINISRKFYEEIMGQTIEDSAGGEYFVYNNGLSITSKDNFKTLINSKEINGSGNNFELYFEHNNIEQFVEKLKGYEIKFVHELRKEPWGQKVVRIYDPDNYIIEIGESMIKKI